MESNTLEYKGYVANINIDFINKKLYGKVINSYDLILIEGESVTAVEDDFHEAVEEHLDMVCRGLAKPIMDTVKEG